MTSLAKTNNLSEPYSIYEGQKLQVPFPNYSKQNEVANEPKVVKEIHKKEEIKEDSKTLISEKLPNENIKFSKVKEKDGFIWPIKGKVVKKFGSNGNEHNDGINIQASSGESVKAAKGGKIVFTGDSLKSFGNLVIIKHSNGLLTAYAHLNSISVKKDQTISQGQEVGKIGQTGKVDSPQLYFAVRKGKQAMNPLNYLN
jgi:murein DD-endopeptidase MepM/ murein hydrolase activator NlpD